MSNLRYLVLNEHTLGYVADDAPLFLHVLNGHSVMGGHHWRNGSVQITSSDALRIATRQDFTDYDVGVPPHLAR